MKFVWAITGAGDLMPEVFDVMEDISKDKTIEITAILSRAAVTVLKWYKLTERLERIAVKTLIEKDANTPFIAGPLQTGRYDFLLAAPLTANTAAKIACGLADTLVSNAVARSKAPITRARMDWSMRSWVCSDTWAAAASGAAPSPPSSMRLRGDS